MQDHSWLDRLLTKGISKQHYDECCQDRCCQELPAMRFLCVTVQLSAGLYALRHLLVCVETHSAARPLQTTSSPHPAKDSQAFRGTCHAFRHAKVTTA